jgi:hypothetical protein
VGELTPGRALVLAVLGGGFITVGALFSVLLSAGVDARAGIGDMLGAAVLVAVPSG